MGDAQLVDLRDDLWLSLEHHTDADPSVAANKTRMHRWINQAYRHLALPTTFRHPELHTTQTITLVTGTQSYAITATNWAIDHIRYNFRNINLKRVSKEAMDRLIWTNTGPPSLWSRWGNVVYLNRTPSSSENAQTLTAFCWLVPTLLAGDSDVTAVRPIFDEPLVEYAAALAWRRLGDIPRSDSHRETYAALINDIRTLDSAEGPQDTTGIELEALLTDYM